MIRSFLQTVLLLTVTWSSFVYAVNFNINEVSFGINGYLDSELDAMDKMAMAMNCTTDNPCSMSGMKMTDGQMLMDMPDSFQLAQNHLNIILSSQTDSVRTNINLESRYAYQSNDRYSGSSASNAEYGRFSIAEAYGEYINSTELRFRFGSFYAPFGMLNQYRYVTPLYSTVVLPFIYEMPLNYSGNLIIPSNSNFMLSGDKISKNNIFTYYVYANAGKRNQNSNSMSDNGVGKEADTDKGAGLRLTYEKEDFYKVGLSYYQILDQGEEFKETYGIDLEILLPRNLRFKSEYATEKTEKEKRSYYLNLSYEGIEQFTPFIMYDYFVDEADALYKFEQSRAGIGGGYNFKRGFTLKLEYHYHSFADRPTASASSGMMSMKSIATQYNNMLRAAAIFSF